MKRWAIFISILVAAVICLLYSSALADSSGTCGADGDNLTWSMDQQGNLIISGTGEMQNIIPHILVNTIPLLPGVYMFNLLLLKRELLV